MYSSASRQHNLAPRCSPSILFVVAVYPASVIEGRPEPPEKEIHEMLGSKREDRLSDPFFDPVQDTSLVRFFVPASPVQFL